jgi:hypothetical protein
MSAERARPLEAQSKCKVFSNKSEKTLLLGNSKTMKIE